MNIPFVDIKSFIVKNFQIVISIVSLLLIMFLWNSRYNTIQELNSLKNTQSINKTINDIDSKLADMNKRNETFYPLINKQLSDLEKQRLWLLSEQKKIKKPTKEESLHETEKYDINEINKYFNDNGYGTSIGICR